mmetsp:Transcript_4844/g.16887  ORF Transcript_4844/g.16887 Transcript_4844/m.16887 type:complete len:349 (-) Transcript_4844:73-1119(-)
MARVAVLLALTGAAAAARYPSELWTAAQEKAHGIHASSKRMSEVWTAEQEAEAGIVPNNYVVGTAPHEQESDAALPDSFSWCNKDGVNYCTMSRNQHLPQYCGSCWAHGSVSALGDRLKIARGAKGIDINLSVQHILNCGNVGSCHGGSVVGPYYWIHQQSKATGTGISYETSNPYLACSSESTEGFCGSVTDYTSCTDMNIARTCSTFSSMGGKCMAIKEFPNATIAEYGQISGKAAMQKEIFARGPIACGIDAGPTLQYESGIATDPGETVDHVVSVVGWGTDPEKGGYWIVRNSWGEYWGEMGYIRVAFGALHLEDQCAWATLADYTAPEKGNQVHCYEGGDNCQ